jgi:hypothetical protein
MGIMVRKKVFIWFLSMFVFACVALDDEPLEIHLDTRILQTNQKRFLEAFKAFLKKISPDCIYSADCPITDWCERSGRGGHRKTCVPKTEDSSECSYPFTCRSGHCLNGKCTKSRLTANDRKDQLCQHSIQCHNDQYCYQNRCINRKVLGLCSSDYSCMSNSCAGFKCEPPRKA